MENLDNIFNELVAKLLSTGRAEFSKDGLNISTNYDNGCLSISASFEKPTEDNNKLVNDFEEYIKSLNDDFFLEVTESFEDGELKKIQDKLDSKNIILVKEGINDFMYRLKAVAKNKVFEIEKDMTELQKDFNELKEIKESYIHVLNKEF